MKSNKLLALIMLAVLLIPTSIMSGAPIKITSNSNSITSQFTNNATEVAEVNYSQLALNLLKNANSSYEKINASIHSLGNIEIPIQVRSQIQEAIRILGYAEGENNIGNYSGSAILAHDAANRFGEALKSLYRIAYDSASPVVEEIIESLKGELDRSLIYLDKLNTSAMRMQEEGYNISEALDFLESAKDLLNSASESIEDKDCDSAGSALGSAHELLIKVNTYLNGVIKSLNELRVERYVNQFSERILEINQTINAVSSKVQLSNINMVQISLYQTKQNLQTISINIQGNVSQSLSSLRKTVEKIESELENLNGNGTGTKLSEMNRILANVQTMKNTAVSLTNRGLNASIVTEQITSTELILDEMKEKFSEGNFDEIDSLIEDALNKLSESAGSLNSNDGNKIIDRVKKGIVDAISVIGGYNSSIIPWKKP